MSAQPARYSLRGTGRMKRRKRVNLAMEIVATAASAVAVAALVWLVVSVLIRGLPALNLDLFTKNQALFGQAGGGIANAIVGSFVIVAFATAFAFPVGVLCAIYVHEFAGATIRQAVRTTLDVLTGVPSILVGIFVFSILVAGGKQSALAGSVALAIIELPLIARGTQEVLALVPGSLREASLALGVSRWRTVLSVVLPTSLSGILTGTMLAIARAAGETAPLLVTSSIVANSTSLDPSKALNSLPVTIFVYSESPDPNQHAQAWAAAFILLVFVLLTNVAARALLARGRRKLEGAPARRRRLRVYHLFTRP
jgi:phosphate transport system permease protein